MAKTKSWKKFVKKQENSKKYLKASLKLYRKESAKYWKALSIAQSTLEVLDATNPAKVAIKEMNRILYGEK